MREVSVQAANDTNNADDRSNLQAEMNALTTEIDRIASVTTWAGQKMMDSNGSSFSFQVGNATGDKNQISVNLNAMSASALGLGGSASSSASGSSSGSGSSSSGTITTPQKIGSEFQVNTYTTGDQNEPDITALSDGGFVVTWRSAGQDGTTYGIYGQRYDTDGAVAGTEFRISSPSVDANHLPSVAPLLGGGFVVSWDDKSQDGSFGSVVSRMYDNSGVEVGSLFHSNTYTTQNQTRPAVTGLHDGGFVNVWQSQSQDGSTYSIYGQRHDSSGGKVNSEFKINTYFTDTQHSPDVITLADGAFAVTWTSNGQDGSGYGVFAQRFDSSGQRYRWGISGQHLHNRSSRSDRQWNYEWAFNNIFKGWWFFSDMDQPRSRWRRIWSIWADF
jgi:flagellin-like hook-associated protein FlgL